MEQMPSHGCFASRGCPRGVENWWGGRAYLVLDQKLDTLDGSSGSLGDGGRNTTHYKHGQSTAGLRLNPPSKLHFCHASPRDDRGTSNR